MKKVYLLLILVSLFFNACSSDSSSDTTSGGPLLKQITTFSDNSSYVSTYNYNGNKIASIVSDTGTSFQFSYTGNLITSMNRSFGTDLVMRLEYSYDGSGKLIREDFFDYDNEYQEIHIYTYNTDNTVIQETYEGDAVTPEAFLGKIKIYLNDTEQFVKLAAFESGIWVTKKEVTYTDYFSPLRNITGFSKILTSSADGKNVFATYTNLNNVDYPTLNDSSVFDYTLNGLNYPTQCVQTTTRSDGSIYETTINYTYY
jgi:hypothetical protein